MRLNNQHANRSRPGIHTLWVMRAAFVLVLTVLCAPFVSQCGTAASRSDAASEVRWIDYAELGREPFLQLDDQRRLLINFTNVESMGQNNIRHLEVTVHADGAAVHFRGTADGNDSPRTIHVIEQIAPHAVMEYRYFWEDANGNLTELGFE